MCILILLNCLQLQCWRNETVALDHCSSCTAAENVSAKFCSKVLALYCVKRQQSNITLLYRVPTTLLLNSTDVQNPQLCHKLQSHEIFMFLPSPHPQWSSDAKVSNEHGNNTVVKCILQLLPAQSTSLDRGLFSKIYKLHRYRMSRKV